MLSKMKKEDGAMFISCKKEFKRGESFNSSTIIQCFDFAYKMTFGKAGEHRHHRSGGQRVRKNGEIFSNTFQGKLSECAFYNSVCTKFTSDDISRIDFDTYPLGRWDDVDFKIRDKKISIKSTKSFGNLLLFEQKDWTSKGEYKPNIDKEGGLYDFVVLVRIEPFCEDIFKKNNWLYSDSVSEQEILNALQSETWYYEVSGFITHKHLLYAIKNQHLIYQKEKLNGRMPMDATNYYIQLGDMIDISELPDYIGGNHVL